MQSIKIILRYNWLTIAISNIFLCGMVILWLVYNLNLIHMALNAAFFTVYGLLYYRIIQITPQTPPVLPTKEP